jgi:hypothetical protein
MLLSPAFPALLLPVRTDHLLYGIAHPDVTLSMEVLRRYHDGDMLVVSSTPDNVRYIDEVGIVGETSVVGVRGLQRGNMRRLALSEMLGAGPYSLADIRPGTTAIDQARIVVEVLAGRSHRLRSGFDVRSLGHELVGRRPDDGTLAAIRPLNPCRVCPACPRDGPSSVPLTSVSAVWTPATEDSAAGFTPSPASSTRSRRTWPLLWRRWPTRSPASSMPCTA